MTMRLLPRIAASMVAGAIRLLTAVRGEWRGGERSREPCVYFANHASNGDFALLWTALPAKLRQRARPVAAADYWLRGAVRRFLIDDVFRGVLIDRTTNPDKEDPIALMRAALDAGDSLILFPEGTRNVSDAPLLPLKSGIYRLASACDGLELVPVWIDNMNRVLPKGERLPIPMLCTVTFGAPLVLGAGEAKERFLERAAQALLSLRAPKPAACEAAQ